MSCWHTHTHTHTHTQTVNLGSPWISRWGKFTKRRRPSGATPSIKLPFIKRWIETMNFKRLGVSLVRVNLVFINPFWEMNIQTGKVLFELNACDDAPQTCLNTLVSSEPLCIQNVTFNIVLFVILLLLWFSDPSFYCLIKNSTLYFFPSQEREPWTSAIDGWNLRKLRLSFTSRLWNALLNSF